MYKRSPDPLYGIGFIRSALGSARLRADLFRCLKSEAATPDQRGGRGSRTTTHKPEETLND